MNFKNVPLLLLLVLFSSLVRSQDNSFAKNTVYGEVLGNAAALSLNYDRIVLKKEKISLSFSLGAGMVPHNLIYNALNDGALRNSTLVYGIPLSCNLFYGKKNHHIETGLGFTYQQGFYDIGSIYSKTIFAVIRVGYRYQKENGGFFWKIGFTPFFSIKEYGAIAVPNPIIPLCGVGLGYTFKKK